jgi:hypothetical protein
MVAVEIKGIAADEQVLMAGEPQHGVARADTDQPLVGLDPNDGGIKVFARPAIPGRKERWVEVDPVVADSDALNFHDAMVLA